MYELPVQQGLATLHQGHLMSCHNNIIYLTIWYNSEML